MAFENKMLGSGKRLHGLLFFWYFFDLPSDFLGFIRQKKRTTEAVRF
jgi:hypothetical protein